MNWSLDIANSSHLKFYFSTSPNIRKKITNFISTDSNGPSSARKDRGHLISVNMQFVTKDKDLVGYHPTLAILNSFKTAYSQGSSEITLNPNGSSSIYSYSFESKTHRYEIGVSDYPKMKGKKVCDLYFYREEKL